MRSRGPVPRAANTVSPLHDGASRRPHSARAGFSATPGSQRQRPHSARVMYKAYPEQGKSPGYRQRHDYDAAHRKQMRERAQQSSGESPMKKVPRVSVRVHPPPKCSLESNQNRAEFRASIWGKSESRGWKYARFLIPSPVSIWIPARCGTNMHGFGWIRDSISSPLGFACQLTGNWFYGTRHFSTQRRLPTRAFDFPARTDPRAL